MRRVFRHLFTALSALSLGLCVTMWVRSCWAADEWAVRSGARVWILRSYDGRLEYLESRFSNASTGWRTSRHHDPSSVYFQEWADQRIRVPYAALVAITACLALSRVITRALKGYVRCRRSRSALCPACGYDLRASPERCPECGTATAKGTT
jgi:hypothetical protein